ncbi:MAG: hypothetical protein ACTS5I_15700 [Rhodanobacter sp.]
MQQLDQLGDYRHHSIVRSSAEPYAWQHGGQAIRVCTTGAELFQLLQKLGMGESIERGHNESAREGGWTIRACVGGRHACVVAR